MCLFLLPLQAFKPLSSKLGFRQLPLGPTAIGHEAPAPPPAPTPAAAISGIPGMPAADTPPCRLVRFDRLATPRLDPPLGPGFRPPGLNPTDSGPGPAQGSTDAASAGGRGSAAAVPQLQYSGVLVCGPKPLWLVASRGSFVVHPMEGGMGAVDAFCGFHNVNCPNGYIAAALRGDMRICTLPLQVRCWYHWPLQLSVVAFCLHSAGCDCSRSVERLCVLLLGLTAWHNFAHVPSLFVMCNVHHRWLLSKLVHLCLLSILYVCCSCVWTSPG